MYLSVRPSVCLSHDDILSKRLNISSNFFHQSSSRTTVIFAVPNVMAIFRRGLPTGGVERKASTKKSRLSTSISLCMRNGTKYRHKVSTEYWLTHALLKNVISNDLEWSEWLIETFKMMIRSIARSLYDSWASCCFNVSLCMAFVERTSRRYLWVSITHAVSSGRRYARCCRLKVELNPWNNRTGVLVAASLPASSALVLLGSRSMTAKWPGPVLYTPSPL